jgi:DNA (cytosine-5)-methyltransferase 1
MLTGVSLFAGVGGFDLAMQRQGVKVVASVEIDKNCNQVLAQHFPDATQFTDVTTVKGEDLINAGFTPSRGIITSLLDGECLMLNTSEYPSAGVESSSLADVLLTQALPKYSLSQKACEGILRRANKRGKTLPEKLQAALVRQASPSTHQE